MQQTITIPLNYVVLNGLGELKGKSQSLFIQVNTDSYTDSAVLEEMIKKHSKEFWSTLWISPGFEGLDPMFLNTLFKITGKDFILELPFGTRIQHTLDLIDTIRRDLLNTFDLECQVELYDPFPKEMQLMGIDFISIFGSGGGCVLVELMDHYIPVNFLDNLEDLRGMWLMHQGLEVESSPTRWVFEHKPTGIKAYVDKNKVLLGKSPYHALAKAILDRTGLDKIKLKFIEGSYIVFSADTL